MISSTSKLPTCKMSCTISVQTIVQNMDIAYVLIKRIFLKIHGRNNPFGRNKMILPKRL